MRRLVIILWVLGFFAVPTHAEMYVESFSSGSNVGEWSFGGPEQIVSDGGNPGAYLAATDFETGAPWPLTRSSESVFVGNYRDRGVTRVGLDVVVNSMSYPVERPCAVTLREDNNTPDDVSDDWAAYKIVGTTPAPGDGWRSIEFEIPSQSETWPDDWTYIAVGLNAPAGDWTDLITDVDALGFHFGDPDFFYVLQIWNLGIDNPWIEWDESVQTSKSSWTEVKLLFLN